MMPRKILVYKVKPDIFDLEASVVVEIERCIQSQDRGYAKSKLENTALVWEDVVPPP